MQSPYMAYSRPIYSRQDTNMAGRLLTGQVCAFDDRQALTIINNWRSSHGGLAQSFGPACTNNKVGAPLLRSVQGRVPRTPAVTLFIRPDPDT